MEASYEDVVAAATRYEDRVNRTPVFTSRTANERTRGTLYFKCENFQRTGSFKFRGALNALLQLSYAQKQRGVIAYSSGNHAQGMALAGRLLGIPTTIIMPYDAPEVKQAATRGYGAEVILYDREETTREALGRQMAEEQGLTLIPPYDHPHIIAGQGTAAKELLEDIGELDTLVVCCGGGGLLSGSALSARHLSPDCRIIGVEPENADDARRSFYSGTIQSVHNPDTIADGARTPFLGQHTFPIIRGLVNDIVTVSDAALVRAMRFCWERMNMIVEPTGVLAAAAVFEGVISVEHQRVGILISGGNVDLERAHTLFAEYLDL